MTGKYAQSLPSGKAVLYNSHSEKDVSVQWTEYSMYSWTDAVADQADLILRRNKVGVRNNNGVSLNDTGNT